MARRILDNVERGRQLAVTVDGRELTACEGETVASVLLVENIDVFYRTGSGRPRAPFCNMGTCFECRVSISRAGSDTAGGWVRACMTPVEEGMQITTGTELRNRP